MKERYSDMERRLAEQMGRLAMSAFYGTTTNTAKEPDEPLTTEKLLEMMAMMKDLPPAPPKIRATPDYIFPQEHYADEVAIIPHHPAHTLFAKAFAPDAPTATVMKAGEKKRPDGTCYQIGDTVYVPSSMASKLIR
jgi:hypothetical protein